MSGLEALVLTKWINLLVALIINIQLNFKLLDLFERRNYVST